MVIPMTIIKSGSRFRALKLLKSRGEMTSQCGYYDHSLDLAFAITYHKAQGRTLDRVLLVFNEAGHAKMTVSSLYVGISRVRHSSHLRILSLSAKQKDMLQRLTFRTELINWWSNVLATGHLAQAHSSSSWIIYRMILPIIDFEHPIIDIDACSNKFCKCDAL